MSVDCRSGRARIPLTAAAAPVVFAAAVDGASCSARFRLSWDLLQVLLLGYVAIAVPYRTCFDIDVATRSPGVSRIVQVPVG